MVDQDHLIHPEPVKPAESFTKQGQPVGSFPKRLCRLPLLFLAIKVLRQKQSDRWKQDD